MKITICDICKRKDGVKKYSFDYDRQMDAAGSYEDVWETFDLCDKCMLSIIQILIRLYVKKGKLDMYKFNKDLIDIIKKKNNGK